MLLILKEGECHRPQTYLVYPFGRLCHSEFHPFTAFYSTIRSEQLELYPPLNCFT